jgi:hypothetical protein
LRNNEGIAYSHRFPRRPQYGFSTSVLHASAPGLDWPKPGHWRWDNMPVWGGDNACATIGPYVTSAQPRSAVHTRISAAIVNGSSPDHRHENHWWIHLCVLHWQVKQEVQQEHLRGASKPSPWPWSSSAIELPRLALRHLFRAKLLYPRV